MAKRRSKASFRHSQVIMICLIILAIIFIAFQRLGFIGEQLDQIINFFFGVRRDILYATVSVYALYREAGFIYTMQFSAQGGLLGVILYSVLTYLLERIGTLIALVISLLILFLLSFNFSFMSEWFNTKKSERKIRKETHIDLK